MLNPGTTHEVRRTFSERIASLAGMVNSSLIVFPSPAERYAVLLDLARTLTGSLLPAELYAGIDAQLRRVLPMDAFAVALNHPDGDLDLVYRQGTGNGPITLSGNDSAHLDAGDFLLKARGAGTQLLVPLARESRVFGCLIAERLHGMPFDASDANFLLSVSQMAGVALDNARLFEAAHQRTEDAERLEAAARELSNSLELDTVVESTAAWAYAIVRTNVVVWVVDDGVARPYGAAGGGMYVPGTELHLPKEWLARSAHGGADAVLTLPEELDTFPAEARIALGLGDPGRHLLPLTLGERVVGFMSLGSPDEPSTATADSIRLLRRMAPHASAAIENARLHGEVRRLSLTDPLVQLPNRRQLDLFLQREFAAAQRGRPLSLVLFDLDRFKEYNDSKGHRGGDIALMKFGELLRVETRAMNLAARYGGEEFVTVLSSTPRKGGEGYAERIRSKLFEESNGTLTVSAGVAEYHESMDTPVALIVAADRALYRAKMDGRNLVRTAPSP
jgi:diguanylate cyclase (GGDEF)-like protein